MKIAIIGAGFAGLTLAQQLKNHADITLFDKARGVGGRMSTRYHQQYQFDHGTQFIRAKTPLFHQFLQQMHQQHIIMPWQARFVEIQNRKITLQRQWVDDHYVAVPKMNNLCKHLARDLTVSLNHKIEQIRYQEGKWQLVINDTLYPTTFDWVISTAPPQQTNAIFKSHWCYHHALSTREMSGCFSLMLGFAHNKHLPWDIAVVKGENISWIANNASKPQRQSPTCLVIHSSNQWADENVNTPIEYVKNELWATLISLMGNDIAQPDYQSLHHWHYANIRQPNDANCYLDTERKLGVCGDWCIRGNVEAAYHSALALAKQIREWYEK